MLDPRVISFAPLLGMLACTASYPEGRGKPEEIVLVDDLDVAPVPPPSEVPRSAASATSTDSVPRGDLIGHGSTSRASPGRYSGSRGWGNFGGYGTRVPTIRLARPEVSGEIDKEIIRRTVRSHIPEVRRCYNIALGRDPNAKGRVTITFEIDGKGKVPSASVKESTMKDPAVGTCIAEAVKGWKFPKSPSPTSLVQIIYPFVLEPG